MNDAGVGVDVALKAHLAPENVMDEGPVVGEAVGIEPDVLALAVLLDSGLLRRRLGVVGHDGGGLLVHRCHEARHMVLLQAAGGGVDVPLTGGVVGIEAVLPGTAAGEVLGGDSHAGVGDAVVAALNPGDDVPHHFTDQGRVLAEGAVAALPAGVGHAVGHVHIALAQVAGLPAAADGFRPLVGHFDAAALDGGGDAQGAGPGGEDAAGVVHAEDDFAVLVPGVGGHGHGDKPLALLGHGLELVQVVRHVVGLGVFPENGVPGEPVLDQGGGAGQVLLAEDGLLVDFALVQHAGLIRGGHMAGDAGAGVLGAHPPVGDEQLADLLIQGHLLDIGSGPLLGGKPPVVDGGDGAGAVNILEIQAVGLQNRAAHRGDVRAVGIVIGFKVFTCLFCHKFSSICKTSIGA